MLKFKIGEKEWTQKWAVTTLKEKLSRRRDSSPDQHSFEETERKWKNDWNKWGMRKAEEWEKKADAEREKEAIYLMQCACKSGV